MIWGGGGVGGFVRGGGLWNFCVYAIFIDCLWMLT